MGFWDDIKTAEVYGKGQYFEPGVYDVEVVRCLLKDTRESGTAFIAELKILKSSNDSHREGTSGSFFQSFKYKQTAMGSVKGFVLACFGMDPVSDKERIKTDLEPNLDQIMNAACDERNALCGRRVHLETFITKTREGNDFTAHRFSPYRGSDI